jgi:hypothetical protein
MSVEPKTLTEGICDLILEAAPERRVELEKLWSEHAPQFVHASDRPGFYIESGAFGLVPFTPRTAGQIWLLGFASWRAFQAYCPYLLLCDAIIPEAMSGAPGQAEADRSLDAALAKAEELRLIEDVERFDWPSDTIDPETSPKTVEDRAIVDLVKMAAAYIFLHEVRHLIFQNAGDRPANPPDEEIACDRFGRDFLLDNIPDYCAISGDAESAVVNKRLGGLALGSFILLRITKNWVGSESHPPLSARLRELLMTNRAAPTMGAWDYVCCLLLGVLRREQKLPPKLAFLDPPELFEKLVHLVD